MKDSGNLLTFLSNELTKCGIDASTPVSPDDFTWTVTRDRYGFIVKTEDAAHAALRGLVESAFGGPKFDSTGTLIFRNDPLQTTVTLHRSEGTTELILLNWKDSEIRAEMEAKVVLAIDQVVDDAIRELEDLTADAEVAPDDAARSSKIDEAQRKMQELEDATQPMGTEQQN